MDETKIDERIGPLRCGMVSIVGRPNTGKSTLLNHIVGEKVAIVSRVPQTTRNLIRGIYNDERGQIIFIDTPGLHRGVDKLDQSMSRACAGTIQGADCIIYLVDVSRRIGEEEESLAAKLKSVKVPIIMGLNKIDLKKDLIPEYIAFWEKAAGKPISEMKFFTLLPLSGREGTNVPKLIDIVFEYLPAGPSLYPPDIISDVPQRMAIADIIREKLFELMHKEIPHSLGVAIEEMNPRKDKLIHIKALIFVERESQKEIVIGKNGRILKEAGTLARKELEDLLETKVFLELYVKVQKKWRDDHSSLQELGYGGV